MVKPFVIYFLTFRLITNLHAQVLEPPDTVTVSSGSLLLKGLLWRPSGEGIFPSVVFCHGSYETSDSKYDPVQQTSVLGPLFAKNGYIFLGLFRQGTGLSKGQGKNSADLMSKALKENGQQARNEVQMRQLRSNDLQDISSGIEFLKHRKEVDANRIALIGHSFGGSLALLVAENDPTLRAVIVFGAGGYSWNMSPLLRTGLIEAVKRINVPVMLAYAQNDYSLTPAYALDSLMTLSGKQHLLRVYPQYGKSLTEGHNIIFLKTDFWKEDVFDFLRRSLH